MKPVLLVLEFWELVTTTLLFSYIEFQSDHMQLFSSNSGGIIKVVAVIDVLCLVLLFLGCITGG